MSKDETDFIIDRYQEFDLLAKMLYGWRIIGYNHSYQVNKTRREG